MAMHASYDCDVVVIGGGIVGLSTAYALTRAAPGTRVTVLDEAGLVRRGTGPGGGLIHSGIRLRPGSPTARYVRRGAAEMAAFCATHGIAHAETGTLIVATEQGELPRLHALAQRGRAHGLPVRELGPAQIAEYEPRVRGRAAVRVGTAGVYDAWAVAVRLAAEVSAAGGIVRYGARAVAVERRPGGVAVRTARGLVVGAEVLVNCAGPRCDRVARLAGDDPGVRIVPFCRQYYALARPELVRALVGPVQDPAFPFPGIRLTRGIDGTVRVGPNACGGGGPHRPASKQQFTMAVRRLLPEVTEDDLRPAPAEIGARAVLRDGIPVDGFLVREGPRTVHVLGAPSSAATASLPLGREVARRALLLGRGAGRKPLPVELGHCV